MDSGTRNLVERLHDSLTMAVVVTAGAGARAIAWLLGVPGASRTVLEALVPYTPGAFAEFLGHEPQQFVSVETAADMAHTAYLRAAHLRARDVPVVGVACTATIATDRPKRGAHRCHIAAWDQHGVSTFSVEFVRRGLGRSREEDVASKLILRALADASHVDFDLPLSLEQDERVEIHRTSYEDPVKALLSGHVSTATVHPDGRIAADEKTEGGVLSGSFNPLHEGHKRLAAVASDLLGADVVFELSITNVDKPPLKEREIRRRLAQFAGLGPVVVTRALVFYEKARLFPGCTFVIGWDTLVRLVDPRYYGDGEAGMLIALEEMRRLGCRFLVAGRVAEGVFRTLDDAAIPRMFGEMFTQIPESLFRCDLSSTDLRLAGKRM